MTLGALFLGAAALAPSARAQSCGNAATLVHSSYPRDGAMGVPTNSPLYLYGPDVAVGTTTITLQDTSGEAVQFEARAAQGGVFVDAFLGFDRATTYDVTVTSSAGDQWSASFTTGTGPSIQVQLRPPEVEVSVIEQDSGTCGPAICVIGSVPLSMTLEVLVGDEVLSLGGGQPAPAYTANGEDVAANDCIDVRVREPGGAVSETTRLCGAQLGRFRLAASAAAPSSCQPYSTVANEDDSDSSSDSGGCTMGASGVASGAGGSLFGLFVLLTARWRSSTRCRRERARAR